jgi:hypothetical protein
MQRTCVAVGWLMLNSLACGACRSSDAAHSATSAAGSSPDADVAPAQPAAVGVAGRSSTTAGTGLAAASGGTNALPGIDGGMTATAGGSARGGTGAPHAGSAASAAGSSGRGTSGAAGGGGGGHSGGAAAAGGSSGGAAVGGNAGGAAVGGATVGTGEIAHPATGPTASDAARIGGMPFVLVKNWDFGTNGTIRNPDDLIAEFVFHDAFNTIANGTHYGAVMVAPNAATAINASGLGLPNNKQPVEDPARPNREWTGDTLKAHVRPLTAAQTSASPTAHNAGNGSFMAKWKLPKGGSLLGQDLLWETRVRFPTPGKAYWFALWTAGNKWNGGAEMDVVESFGASNSYPPANSFHVDPVGGSASVKYSNWASTLDSLGVSADKRDLTKWHVFSWLYAKDDTYKVYFDGVQVQSGTIHWTNGGAAGGEAIDLEFMYDFGWGWVKNGSENQIPGLDAELPASAFPLTYEIDYSRVYLR